MFKRFFNICFGRVGALALALIGSIAFFSYASAQDLAPIKVPYILGFEEADSLEISHWNLNPGSQAASCQDHWIIGSATRNGGRRSLYISADSVEATFGAKPNVQYVYRDFTIEAGRYECSFDYRCMGATNSSLSAGISFISSLQKDMQAKAGSSSIPASVSSARMVKDLKGSVLWKNTSFAFNATDAGTYRIFWVWQNGNTDTTLAMPVGACIDNIQITTTNCAKPKNLQATAFNDTVLFTWQGTSEQYIFERRKRGTDKWYLHTGLTQKKIILEGLSEGSYDFRVRGVCNDIDTSAYAYLNSFVVYYPDRHCIDFIHLDNENIHGTIGTYKDPYYSQDTLVDFGEDNKFSRHTLNTEPDMYDPRTGNRLRTIPEGEFASVRLGNWNVGAEAESMSFEFEADSFSNALVLLKYAIVMEDPGHTMTDQPRFKMEILDQYDQLVDPTCGAADFYADMKRDGWNVYKDQVAWKDWTTIGMNLMEMGLAGQLITIRFTTYDCNWSGHYGYAYFTLDCAAATITSSSCGDDPVMTVNAPSGFDCQWFNKNEELVSTSSQLSVAPSDTTTYRCHLIFKENPECGFDLYTASKPRYPVADFSYEWAPANCENRVRFFNHSHVMNKFDGYVQHNYDEPCDEYQWDFGNGNLSPDENPVYIFPKEGGDFPVTLVSSIADGRCTNDTTVIVHIPAIGDTEQFLDTAICQGDWVVWGDRSSDNMYYAAEDGEYRVNWSSVAGCDSTWVLRLKVRPVSTVQTPDTIACAEIPLVIDDQVYKYTTSGKFYRFFKNQYGCDSTRWCNVTIVDSILPIVTTRDMTEVPNSGAIFISGTGFDYFIVSNPTLGDTTVTATGNDSIAGLNGGRFVLEFFNSLGCSIQITVQVGACLPGYIFQRWNDVLSLKDSAYIETIIGDFGFKDFQWYKNEQPIEGASLSYLYVPEGLDPTAQYVLKMVRISNGEQVETCPFMPTVATQETMVYVYPSPVKTGGTLTVKVSEAASLTIVNMFGDVVLTQSLSEGENSITMSVPAGIYVVQVQIGSETRVCRISVIE